MAVTKPKLGEYLKAINSAKTPLMDDPFYEKNYPKFIVNRIMGFYPDTVFLANEMNKGFHELDNKLHFEFLRRSCVPKSRFYKFSKKTNPENLELIMDYYNVGKTKAEEMLNILSDEEIKELYSKTEKGGIV